MARLFDDDLSQYLRHANPVIGGRSVSMACWFYIDALIFSEMVSVHDTTDTSGLTGFVLGQRGDGSRGVRFFVQEGGTFKVVESSGSTVQLDTWHHAAATFADSDGNIAVYKDGTDKVTDGSAANPTTMNDTTLGCRNYSGSYEKFHSGGMAEVGIWDAVLTDAEVAALARGVPPWKVRPQSLVAYWPLWGVHDPEIDLSGNGNNLTLYNGPTRADHAPVAIFTPKIWTLPEEIVTLSPPAAPSNLTAAVI